MLYHKDNTIPNSHSIIWVFGSNMKGYHGAGAALIAKQKFGAPDGLFMGQCSRSYAIATEDSNLKPLQMKAIVPQIEKFVEHTINNPGFNFFVTRVGCGYAGYTDDQIGPLFAKCGGNCSLAEQWRQYRKPNGS